jgi:hypothetical protein
VTPRHRSTTVFEVVEGRAEPFDRIGLGDVPLARLRDAVSRANGLLQRRLQCKGVSAPFLNLVRGGLLVRGLSGRLRLLGATLDVRPKFMGPQGWAGRWSSLVALGTTRQPGLVTVLDSDLRGVDAASTLLDPVAEWFVTAIESALRDGPISLYQRVCEPRSQVRGRILTSRTVQRGPLKAHQPVCSYSRMTTANPATHLLRWCCEELGRWVRFRVLRRRLQQAAAHFAVLPGQAGDGAEHVRLPPGAARYSEPLAFAQRFWRSRRARTPDCKDDRESTASVVAVMHSCFEALVSALYRRLVARRGDIRHRRQAPRYFLEREGAGIGNGQRMIFPDDELFDAHGGLLLSSDAKYKGSVIHASRSPRVERRARIAASDLAQLYAACAATGSGHGFIVQPLVEDLPEELPLYEVWGSSSESVHHATLVIFRLDLRHLTTESRLEVLVDQLEGCMVDIGVLPERTG